MENKKLIPSRAAQAEAFKKKAERWERKAREARKAAEKAEQDDEE